MIPTTIIRGYSICSTSSRVIESRIVSSRSFYRCSPLLLQRHSQYIARTLVSAQNRFQLPPAETILRPETYRYNLSSITALHNNVQKELLNKQCPLLETEILLALQACHSFAGLRLEASSSIPADADPTSALLLLDEDVAKKQTPFSSSLSAGEASGRSIENQQIKPIDKAPASVEQAFAGDFDVLTDIAYKIVSHPSVFLTIPILASFVSLQSLVGDPSPIPAVFSLYANKPFSPQGSLKIQYPNPRQAKHAIPSSIASAALQAAIKVKDMSLCLDIIDTSYGVPAHQRSKIIRRAVPAAVACCLTPLVAFALANTLAQYQEEVDHSLAVKYAFAGMLAYLCFTGSIGVVALMTANDQMVRVTWVAGTPLRERWLREEERVALDKVAQAWGFEEPNKRGFEEGDEWELLREVVSRKGMYLDNPALMDGME